MALNNSVPGPGPWPYLRYGHTVSAYGHLVILFGGRNDKQPCNVTWVFNTIARNWCAMPTSGTPPPERDGHTSCIIGDWLYIHGGYEELHLRFGAEVYRLNLVTWQWQQVKTKGAPPTYRDFHTATAIGDDMYIFGGRSDSNSEDAEGWFPAGTNTEYYSNKIVYLVI